MSSWIYAFLCFWFVAVAVPTGYFMGFHLGALTPPELAKVEPLFKHNYNQWHLDHLLGDDCECSARVGEYLAKRKPLKMFVEKVYVVGKDSKLAEPLRGAGFEVEEIDAEVAAQKYGITAFPVLYVYNPVGSLTYSGGYSMNRFASSEAEFEDVQIAQASVAGKKPIPRPIFGCSNGIARRRQIDPLHLKYSENHKRSLAGQKVD